MRYDEMTREALQEELSALKKEYRRFQAMDLRLDMSRGKPSIEQLNLSMGLMDVLDSTSDLTCEDGTDCRNYGQLTGIEEARELLDYYDEFSIRVAFLMLHDLYEQVIASQELSNLGFENFIIGALESDVDQETLRRQASLRHLSLTDRYTCVLLRCSAAAGPSLQAVRTELLRAFRHSTLAGFCMLAITGENEAILFIKQDGGPISRNKVRALLRELHDAAAKSIPGLQVDMGGTLRGGTLAEVRSCVDRCRRALQRGSVVFPGRKLVFYEDLGPIAWLDIPGEELELMLRDFRRIMEEEKNIELLKTLQIYLQSNMNYSQTAEKMYVHINTIRKRLDKLSEIITLDLDDPVERLNTELLLQFLELQSGERGPAGDE